MLTEQQGCAVLKRVFQSRGFQVQENVPFKEDDVSFQADGWDPQSRVGYEYMTHQADDFDDLDPREIGRLGEWADAGRLYFFVIDDTNIETVEDLEWAANRFLDEVVRRKGARP
ncbi:MAG: hypothetical protein HY904_12030 [Deltaproteobacteria bacterium]|nr:hypothetical protein [Deltaproteobacteria bacterium]